MSGATRAKNPAKTVVLSMAVRVEQNTMYLRSAMADGEVEHDGHAFKVDVSSNVNGSGIVVGVHQQDKKGWTNYVLTTETLMRAVLDHHLEP